MTLTDLPRLQPNDFKPVALGATPCVVANIASRWTALRTWNALYLKQVAGTRKVVVRRVRGAPTNIYGRQQSGRVSFGDFVDWLESVSSGNASEGGLPADTYYLDCPLAAISPSLFDDITVPKWFPAPPQTVLFWAGICGSSSGLHFDVQPNCNVQVLGRKRFILYSPDQLRWLYPRHGSVCHCQFDPNNPDYDRFPLAKKASGFQGTLSPGDSVYIPPGWYHQVQTVSPWAVNVNFWWSSPRLQVLVTPVLRTFLLKRYFGTLRKRFSRVLRLEASPTDQLNATVVPDFQIRSNGSP